MDLRDLLSVLRSRWRSIAGLTVIGGLLGLGLSLLTTPLYSAKITFYVTSDLEWTIMLDVDASVVATHSEKVNGAPTYKRTFGDHSVGV